VFIANGLNAELEESLQTAWNAKVLEYDNDQFPFNEWILDRIRKMGYDLDDLTETHNVVPDIEIFKVTKQLCADTNLPEYRRMVNNLVRDVIVPKTGLQMPVGVQRFHNVRINVPNKPAGTFPFHTGLLYGHGPASRSLWMPLTDVSSDEMRNASMQILGINESRKLIQEAVERRLSIEEMTDLFSQNSKQCRVKPGSMVLFTQENIHGSDGYNDTGKTRVSIDWRLSEARHSDQLCRKIAGGYFEIIPESEAEEDWNPRDIASLNNGKKNIVYLNNATSATFGIPVHLQRYMVLDYLKKNEIVSEFELFELEDMSHLPTLNYITSNLKTNVVLYSVFSLPENAPFRKKILDFVIENGLIMHFVNENMVIDSEENRDKVERLLSFAKFGETVVGLPSQTTIDLKNIKLIEIAEPH
jgi:sporadic carbohydrate cluster protein (TIGR04323 family)